MAWYVVCKDEASETGQGSEQAGFKDWTHAETGAPMLKAQHPEFELWSQGVHARSGVTCVDCHMPYKLAGGMKVSDWNEGQRLE